MGGYLMLCGMASLSVSSALWLTATSGNPIAVTLAEYCRVNINFGSKIVAASLPVLTMIAMLPFIPYRLFPPGLTNTPNAPKAARDALRTMGPPAPDESTVAVAFAFMVTGWVMVGTLNLSLAAAAFAGLVDINLQGSTLVTFIWLAVLFALSGELNELGFMGYVGGRLTSLLEGLTWPIAYVVLLVLYVVMHYMFVSQTAQILALFDVFLGVGVKTCVSPPLMAFALLFASSYFSNDHSLKAEAKMSSLSGVVTSAKAGFTDLVC